MKKVWPTVPLGEVLTHRKEFVTIDDLQTYKRPRVQLHAQGIVVRDEVPGALIKTKKQQLCRAGDFLVAEIDAKVGGFGIIPSKLDGAIVSSHYFLFVANETRLDRRFLGWFIKTPAFREQVEAQGSTNYAAIRPDDVLGYEVPLPPLAEQRRIVARVEELAGKIAESSSLRSQAAEQAEAIWERRAEQVFDAVAEEFQLKKLADCVSIRGGGTPSKANPFYWEGRIPWVTPKDMKTRSIFDAVDHITEQAIQQSSARVIDPGAVLVVVRGMILAHTFPSGVLRVPAAINQDMKALLPMPDLLPEYLCLLFWGLNRRILETVEKSTHDTRKLETEILLSTKIPVPPLSEQHSIVTYLGDLQSKVDALKRLQADTAAELDALLPSILDKAFKGEL